MSGCNKDVENHVQGCSLMPHIRQMFYWYCEHKGKAEEDGTYIHSFDILLRFNQLFLI